MTTAWKNHLKSVTNLQFVAAMVRLRYSDNRERCFRSRLFWPFARLPRFRPVGATRDQSRAGCNAFCGSRTGRMKKYVGINPRAVIMAMIHQPR
jgi:hypothetical protein